MKNADRTVFAMRAIYFLICGIQFIGQSYISIYLRDFSFTNDVTVGLMISLGYLVTTVAQPVWGAAADHAVSKNKVLGAALLGVAAALWFFILPEHSSYLTLVPSVALVFLSLLMPGMLADTIIVENIDITGVPFASVKCFYSAGAGAVALILFLLSLAVSLKPSSTFVIAFFCAVLSLIPLRLLPVTKGHARGLKGGREKKSLKAILANRRLVLLLCYILFLFMGVKAAGVFLGIYYATDQGLNGGLGTYGLFFTICTACEASLMSFGNRFLKKISTNNIFLMVSAAASLRALTIFLSTNIYIIQVSAVFHAFTFAPLWGRLAPYVNSIVTKEMRATGQAAWSLMAFGVGPVVGSALGGMVADRFGIRNLFLVIAVFLFAVAIAFFFLFRHEQTLDKTDCGEMAGIS